MSDTDFNYGANEKEDSEYKGDCGATIECPHCRTFFGFCSDVSAKLAVARGETMLPSGDQQEQGGRRKRSGGMEYLTNEMLSKIPKEAKILAVKLDTENRFGSRVVLKLAFDGKTVFWGVNIKKNPNYQILLKKFGQDENDWAGQKILIGLEPDEFTDQYFAHVTFPPKGK